MSVNEPPHSAAERPPSNHPHTRPATGRTDMLPPYSTLGQLSYAPATQTTVVTTTTTTTTSFPPLLIQAPRRLAERDPKLYPLASSPTPELIKKLSFDVNGRPAYFEEARDPALLYRELQQRHASLQASNGIVQCIEEHRKDCDTPTQSYNTSTASSWSVSTGTQSKKRSAPQISIAEAAALADGQRRAKKPRMSLEYVLAEGVVSTPAAEHSDHRVSDSTGTTEPGTPDTELGDSDRRENLQRWKEHRRGYGSWASTDLPRTPSGLLLEQEDGVAADDVRPVRLQDSRERGNLRETQRIRTRGEPPSLIGKSQVPRAAATPPIGETDFEVMPPASFEPTQQPNIPRLSPLNTAAAQDASLPSPSLSPITAAANLANRGSAANPVREGLRHPQHASSMPGSSRFQEEDSRQGPTPYRSSMTLPGHVNIPITDECSFSNAQFRNPTLMDVPTLIDSFDALPDQMKTYMMYQFLRRCAKQTLHFVADVVSPALKCDFVARLPLELSFNVIRFLDAKGMCGAAQVSKKWRQTINSDEKAWKDLLDRDGYVVPNGELERAVREGWGWQSPYGAADWEKDISDVAGPTSDSESFGPSAQVSRPRANRCPPSMLPANSLKRRVPAMYPEKRKHKKSRILSDGSQLSWADSLERAQGPNAFAALAALAVPNPNLGLPGLKGLHLFKSLYARHHIIGQNWMDSRTKPRHVAFRAHQRHVVTCLQFDSEKILTGSDDTNIHVYDTKTGAIRTRLEGHEGGVWTFEYDGNTLVSGSTDRSVRIWDIDKGKCLHVFQGHTSTVRCLQIVHPREVRRSKDGTPIMMPKQTLIVTGSRDSTLRVWRLPLPGERTVYQTSPPANDHENPYFCRQLTGHQHSVRAIAACADILVSGSYDSTVRVWKTSTGETLHRLTGHTAKVYSVVLDYERGRCISGSMDNLVKVWSVETGSLLFNLEGHTSLVGLLDLRFDRLVSAAADSTLRIWEPENGQCKSTLSAHTGAITCFQHDNQKVISGSDRTLKMWNIKTADCVRDLLTELSGVWQVKFDERRCVAAVQRKNLTYIEVLDFGACRDGVPEDQRGRRIHVDTTGIEVEDYVEPDPENP